MFGVTTSLMLIGGALTLMVWLSHHALKLQQEGHLDINAILNITLGGFLGGLMLILGIVLIWVAFSHHREEERRDEERRAEEKEQPPTATKNQQVTCTQRSVRPEGTDDQKFPLRKT